MSDAFITLRFPATPGATGYDIYREVQHPVYQELRGWRRLLALTLRLPTRRHVGWRTDLVLVAAAV